MPALTIGGQVRELRLTGRALATAERQILKLGGKKILATLGSKEPDDRWFALDELAVILGVIWGEDRAPALLEQFYGEGGTVFDVHSAVVETIIDSRLFGTRASANGTGARADPPMARTSA